MQEDDDVDSVTFYKSIPHEVFFEGWFNEIGEEILRWAGLWDRWIAHDLGSRCHPFEVVDVESSLSGEDWIPDENSPTGESSYLAYIILDAPKARDEMRRNIEHLINPPKALPQKPHLQIVKNAPPTTVESSPGVIEGESSDIVQKMLLWASDGTADLWKVWHDHYLAEDTHPLRLFENAEGLRYDARLIDPCWPDLDFYVVIDHADVAKASIKACLNTVLEKKLENPRIKPVPPSRV